MNQDTPAATIKAKDLQANVDALKDCLSRIPKEDVLSILDIRYGLGGWARACLERFLEASLVGYEQDEETAVKAWRDKRVSLWRRRFDPNSFKRRCDLLLADFNTLTKLKRELLDEALAAVDCKWLIFTDVACSKLHLNYLRSYGMTNCSIDEYWESFKVDGYRFMTYARHHYAACTALYQKKKPRP